MTAATRARPRRWSRVSAWALWALVMLGIPVAVWLNHLLRQAGRSDQAGSNVDTVIYLLAVVSAVTVGAVLASRRPRHPVGWLLLALGLWFTYGYATWVLLAWRGAPSAVGDAAKDVSVFVMAACIGFVLLLTPTGSLPSPRWRWWARVLAVAAVGGLVSSVVGPLAVRALAELLQVARYVAFVITGLAIPVGVASLVVRFRRARGLERQQLRWLAVGAAPVAVAVLAIAALVLAGNEVSLGWLVGVCLAVLPAGDRRGDPPLSALRPGPHHQPHTGLRAAHAAAGWRLRRSGPGARPAPGADLEPGRRRGHHDGRRGVPAGPPPHPAGGRPALQPAPPRRRPDDPGVQRAAAPAGRPGGPDG